MPLSENTSQTTANSPPPNAIYSLDAPHALTPSLRRLLLERAGLDFTVVIPTYNGANRIGAVLNRLRYQIGTHEIAWEIIVVDNNSIDTTAAVIRQYQQQWPKDIPLRYEFEPKQGAGYARQLGIKRANSPLVGFIDDDNLPWPNWVCSAYSFGQHHPEAGAYGSRILGKFTAQPPPNFERIAALLALTNRGNRSIPYHPQSKILPPGAGLVVRRQAWLDNVPEERRLADKFGHREAGEDLEAVLRIQQASWQIWYNAQMWMYHEIPPSRLTRSYLTTLCWGIGLSRYHTRMLSFARWKRPWMVLPYAVNDLKKIVVHVCRYRQLVLTDTVSASEMNLYVASLISPLHSWYRLLKKRKKARS